MTQKIDSSLDFGNLLTGNEINTDDMAYVKKETIDDESVWMIYSAFGEKMGYAANRDVALAIAHQNDLYVQSVH